MGGRLRSKRLKRMCAALLKSWNHVNSHRPLSASEATDTRWKKLASSLLPYLSAGAQTDFPASLSLDEVTIVPDGASGICPSRLCRLGVEQKPNR